MMDMATHRCGSCNCNELSPRRRSSNRFSSRRRPLTITLTTLMIFSFFIAAISSPIEFTTTNSSATTESVELAMTTTHEQNSTKPNSTVVLESRGELVAVSGDSDDEIVVSPSTSTLQKPEENNEISIVGDVKSELSIELESPSITEDLEQTIRDSVKNEIEMDLERDGSAVSLKGSDELLSIEYPQKEIGDHIVITQTDKETHTITVDGIAVREARNLHDDTSKFVDLLSEDVGHESPEGEVQSVEKQQEIESHNIASSSSSKSSESENTIDESLDTSENLIDDEKPSLSESQSVADENLNKQSETKEKPNEVFALPDEEKEDSQPLVEEKAKDEEEPKTVVEEKTSEEPKVDVKAEDEKTMQESNSQNHLEKAEELLNIADNIIDSEPTPVKAKETEPILLNSVDKIVEPTISSIPDAIVPVTETIAPLETVDENVEDKAIQHEDKILSVSEDTEVLKSHELSNSVDSVSEVSNIEVVHNSIDSVASETAIVPAEKNDVPVESETPQEQALTTTPNIVLVDKDEEVLSVVLNENTDIAEPPSNSLETISSEPEDGAAKPEETDDDVEDPVLPQDIEHAVIKKQGVDPEEVEVEATVATTTIKPEETHHLVIKKEGVEPVVSNEAEESEQLPEDDENVYEDDEADVQSPPQVVDVTEDVKVNTNSNNEVTDNEADTKVEEEEPQQEAKVDNEPEQSEVTSEQTDLEEAETTTVEPTSSERSLPLANEDTAATLFESLQPRNAGQTFNDNVLTAESLGGIGKALPTRSINDNHTQRSSVIIVLCSGVAVLFVVISVTIFAVSFQRQHGTLDIEMQEKRCGKDNRDEDPESCLKLLDIELPITMLPTATATTTTATKSSTTIIMEESDSEASMPMTTLLTTDEIDECL